MTESLRFPAFPTASDAFPEDPGTVSREGPESADRFPAGVSPFPAVSDRFPPRFPASGTEPVLPRPALSTKRDAGNGPSTTPSLPTWIDSLKTRDLTINTGPDGPTINGRNLHLVTPHDTHQLTRHRHTLHLAATGTHPTWWTYACGRDRTTWPTVDELPWTCATCGTPHCAHLDADLLAWCDQHVRLEEIRP